MLKLFKTEAKLSAQMMRDQYEACRRLHADLDGQRAGGWSVCAPAALFLCAAPPAIMMTLAPGVDLNVLTARNDALTPQQVDEAGRALAGALAASWARGRMHGDLALQNVLCRAADKTIALIDAGTPAHCRTCYARRADTAASTLDPAHLLSDISADVKRTIGRRGVQVRRENFVGSVLRAALADAGNGAEKHRRLAEIDACARLHLLELLQFSYSPRGIWRVVVKREALRRLDRIFASLAPEFQNEPPAAVEARRA